MDINTIFKPKSKIGRMILILTSFNIKNIRSNVGLSIIVAIILGLLIFSSSSIIPILVLVLDIIIFIVITFLAKSFVTVVTLSVY